MFLSHFAIGQNTSSYFKDFANKDLSSISKKFSSSMEVCVNNTQDFMDKGEAIKAIQNFLNKVEPTSGSELHKGNSKSADSQYSLGKLATKKGNFRVFIYTEGDAKNYEIVGILFNPE